MLGVTWRFFKRSYRSYWLLYERKTGDADSLFKWEKREENGNRFKDYGSLRRGQTIDCDSIQAEGTVTMTPSLGNDTVFT
jgi:hypothetical protein